MGEGRSRLGRKQWRWNLRLTCWWDWCQNIQR